MTRACPGLRSASPSPQDGRHHEQARRSWNIAAIIACLLCLAACNFRTDSGQLSAPGQAAAVTSNPPPLSNVQVSTQPALTPNFQTSIHDYVIDCNASPSVYFSAKIGDEVEVFVNGAPVATAQATVPLVAGQRFTFAFERISSDLPRFISP